MEQLVSGRDAVMYVVDSTLCFVRQVMRMPNTGTT